MNSIKKITIVGCALVASTALLFSFTNDNGGDKNKKYQIIHYSNGEMITHDTVIPMASSYTPEQFVADMGITSENIEILEIPDVSELEMKAETLKTIVHEIEIEGEENKEEHVEIKVEIDENGEMNTRKTVNGEEVELTEEEIQDIKIRHSDHGRVIEMHIDDEEIGDKNERVEISVGIDAEGNKVAKKTVNGEEVDMTQEEIDRISILEKATEEMNLFITSAELENDMHNLEIELEEMIKEEGDNVRVFHKRIEIHTDEDRDHNWISDDGEQRIMMISSDSEEDHTIVLVTENYDESTSHEAKMMFESSSEEMEVYPNPNNGIFNIRYESNENQKTTVTVTDASGKKVFEEKLGKFSGTYEKEIDLKKIGSGMYTITIQNGNNKEVQKVMIK